MQPVRNLQELIERLREDIVEHSHIVDTINSYTNKTLQIRIEAAPAPKRILLTTIRNKYSPSWELHQQCNGVILSYPNWELISMPPKMFIPSPSISHIRKHINNYMYYPALDGTIVTLYWYGEWCMATKNGFSVGNYKWMGNYTYKQALDSVLSAHYPNFSYDKLDKSKSYSIGFRFHDFHPFIYDTEYVWFVSSFDVATFNHNNDSIIDYNEDIGVTLLESNLLTPSKFNEILTTNKYALINLYETIKSADVNKIPHYGYVLRALDQTSSDVMLESTLLSTIRTLMYNIPKNKSDSITINEHTRCKYMALRAYLGNDKKLFANLFSAQYYNQFDYVFDTLIKYITRQSPQITHDFEQNIKIVANTFAAVISTNNINIHTLTGENIIRDIILDKKYTDLYFKHLI